MKTTIIVSVIVVAVTIVILGALGYLYPVINGIRCPLTGISGVYVRGKCTSKQTIDCEKNTNCKTIDGKPGIMSGVGITGGVCFPC